MVLLNKNGIPLPVPHKSKSTIQWKPEFDTENTNEITNVSIAKEWRKAQLKRIEDIINTHENYADIYYIVIFAKQDMHQPHVINEKFIVMDQHPGPMFGCQLYKVDNRRGTLTLEYILPLDCPTMNVDEYVKEKGQSPVLVAFLNKHNMQPLASADI